MKPAVVLAAAVLAIASGATASQASAPSRIVFSADRSPTLTGEIYRLDPNGHRVDLSKSPNQDTNPAVSPDGKRVAFISDRSGKPRLYEVGIDGRGLHRITATSVSNLAWQPHGSLLAVEQSGNEVRIVGQNGKTVVASRHSDWFRWSPDGRILLVYETSGFRAVTPQGSTLWTAFGDYPTAEWSPQGRLAVPRYHGATVYDEQGHRLLEFPLPDSSATFSWSPDGRYLAALTQDALATIEVRTISGTLLLTRKGLTGDMAWAGNSTLVVGVAGCSTCKTVGIAVRNDKTVHVSPNWLDPRSADGKLAAVTPASGSGFALGVARPDGRAAKTYRKIGGCLSDGDWEPAASGLQFAGVSRSLVYVNWDTCDAPPANLYSVDAAGGAVHRLTKVRAQETQPSLSPDGSEIAYVWAYANGMSCKGCSDGIRIASADGTPIRTLTNPQDCTFDDAPTWSPDGKTILYAEGTCDTAGELFTVPAAGGSPHDLGIKGQVPAWGPSKIAFAASDLSSSCAGLCTMNPDGSDLTLVTKHGWDPAWAPDGRLAYLTSGATVVAGSTRLRLPFAKIESLAWSPDGTRFVVVAQANGSAGLDVYSVRTDGTHLVRLTTDYGALGKKY